MGTYVSIAGLVDICCQCLVWIGVIGSLLHFYCKIPMEKYPRDLKSAVFFFYLPSAVFIALMLVGPIKRLKQVIQIKRNRVKNPNWPEANQLAIYKHGQGFELRTTMNKSS